MQSIDWRYCTLWNICLPLAKPFLDESIIFTETGTVFSIEKKIVPISIVTVAKIQTFIRWYFCILSVQCSQIFLNLHFYPTLQQKVFKRSPINLPLLSAMWEKRGAFSYAFIKKHSNFQQKISSNWICGIYQH